MNVYLWHDVTAKYITQYKAIAVLDHEELHAESINNALINNQPKQSMHV